MVTRRGPSCGCGRGSRWLWQVSAVQDMLVLLVLVPSPSSSIELLLVLKPLPPRSYTSMWLPLLLKDGGRRKTEDRRWKTEDGRWKTEDGRQKTEDRRRKTGEMMWLGAQKTSQ